MSSRFFNRAKTIVAINRRTQNCNHRGPTLRVDQKPCCGAIEIFYCPKLGREVWHTKCRSCEHYESDEGGETFDGTVSLLINTHNEGPDLLQTIESFHARCRAPMEVLVLADCTTDDSLDNLPDYVRVFRHDGPERMGCGTAKALLTREATGDFILHSDGHNRLVSGTVDAMAQRACQSDCVVQPALGPIRVTKPHEQAREGDPGNCYYGGRLTIEKGMPNIHQSTLRPREEIKRVQCVNNSCFGYPRTLLKAFAGWHQFPGAWGFQEAGFSLRLWFAGVPIYCMRDLVVLHRYQDWWDGPNAGEYKGKRKGYSTPGWHRRANRRYAAKVCFDSATWDGFWKTQFELVDRDDDGKANAAIEASAVDRQHAEFMKVKKRTDEEWFKEVAKMEFNPATAKVNEGAERGLYLLSGGLGNALMCVPAMKALAKLTGRAIDIWDRGLHVKALAEWLRDQPWARTIHEKDARVDYRDYRFIIGSYWASPEISILDGCTISPAFRQHRTKHEAFSNMEAVRRAGYGGPTPTARLRVPDGAAELQGGYVAICTEAAGRRDDVNKCYPRWEEVCRDLKARSVEIVFLGNNAESPDWMDECAAWGDGFGPTNLVGQTDFLDAVRIIQDADLYLGIDNGLAHVAAAVGTPMCLIYGPTSPRKNLQLSQAVHVIASDYACAPCFDTHRKNKCKDEPDGAKPCMRAIDPKRVANKVLHLLDQPYHDALSAQQIFLSRKQMVQNLGLEMFQQWDEMTHVLDVMRQADPVRVLVIGTHHGAWELVMSGACSPGTEFIMLDIEDFPERAEAEKLLRYFGFKTTFILGDSGAQDTATRVAEVLGSDLLDVLYIDGNHEYDAVDRDYRNYSRLVRPGGLIVLHDVWNFINADGAGSRRHWNDLKNTETIPGTVEIRHGRTNGYGIIQTERASQ